MKPLSLVLSIFLALGTSVVSRAASGNAARPNSVPSNGSAANEGCSWDISEEETDNSWCASLTVMCDDGSACFLTVCLYDPGGDAEIIQTVTWGCTEN